MVVVLAIERAIFYNWKHFWLETDSTLVLHAFSHPKSVHWSIYNRWMNCINHINHINFRISHIYREGNVCVAKLASFGAQILSGPKTFLYIFFCFLPMFDWEFLFLFCFLLVFDQDFFSFRGRGWKFSSRVKVYGELGFWLKACRTTRHDICQGVGLANGSGIKECPTLFP